MEQNPPTIPIRPPMPSREEFEKIVKAANAGDRKALSELRRTLDERPEIWQRVGNLSSLAGTSFLCLASNGNHLVRASISRYVAKLRKELLGLKATPLERIAIERLLLSWAMAHYTDCVVLSLTSASPGTMSMWLKRQAQASRQLDQAIKSLATLRRLLPAAERASAKSRRA